MFLLPLFLLLPHCLLAKTIYFDEICDTTGRRIYLELGENGLLTSKNATVNTKEICKRCVLEIITCSSCIISYKFNFLKACGTCCDDCVSTHELPFETTSSRQFCGCFDDSNYFKTKTRSLSISFLYNEHKDGSFNLEYNAQRNRQFLDDRSEHILASPFFPAFYPTDLSMEYVIDCKMANCTINLLFTDFLVPPTSLIEFFDWNGQRIFLTTGDIFRPPLITSSGPTLVTKFFANGATSLGFKAEYFFSYNVSQTNLLATDCGGYIDATGGVIIFANKPQNFKYNCYWIVRPSHNYLNWKTHLYLSIVTFSNFQEDSTLTVHKGITSNDEILNNNKTKHTVPLTTGFYISLNGFAKNQAKLVMVYSAFNYKNCLTEADFLCHNQRCISILLRCDGLDHCGDNSDESVSCKRNFGRYYDLRTAAAIFVICSLGITCLIFGIIVLLYRININNQNRIRFRDHLETINAILEEGNLSVEVEEIIISDDPPDYEAPPEYNEIIKNQPSCSLTPNSPPPSYTSQMWLRNSFKQDRMKSDGRLVVSCSEGNLEKCFSFNVIREIERSCVIRRSQSIESFMALMK